MASLRRSVARFGRRYWPVLLAVLLGLACGLVYQAVAPPTYLARAVVIVTPTPTASASATAGRDIAYAQVFSRIVDQPDVLAPAAAQAGTDVESLRRRVTSVSSTDTPSVEVDVTAGTAEAASASANAVAGSLIRYGNSRTADTEVTLAVLGAAYPPARPTSPIAWLSIGVGLAVGVLLGALLLACGIGRPRASSPPSPPASPPPYPPPSPPLSPPPSLPPPPRPFRSENGNSRAPSPHPRSEQQGQLVNRSGSAP